MLAQNSSKPVAAANNENFHKNKVLKKTINRYKKLPAFASNKRDNFRKKIIDKWI